MSTSRILKAVVLIGLTALLWNAAAGLRNGLDEVARYAPAGLVSGMAFIWIFRTFAWMPHTRRSLLLSGLAGLFAFTPVIAMLLIDSTDTSTSSEVVLAFAAGAGAAMGGAIYGVATLAHDAFADWRHERIDVRKSLAYGGAHR